MHYYAIYASWRIFRLCKIVHFMHLHNFPPWMVYRGGQCRGGRFRQRQHGKHKYLPEGGNRKETEVRAVGRNPKSRGPGTKIGQGRIIAAPPGPGLKFCLPRWAEKSWMGRDGPGRWADGPAHSAPQLPSNPLTELPCCPICYWPHFAQLRICNQRCNSHCAFVQND